MNNLTVKNITQRQNRGHTPKQDVSFHLVQTVTRQHGVVGWRHTHVSANSFQTWIIETSRWIFSFLLLQLEQSRAWTLCEDVSLTVSVLSLYSEALLSSHWLLQDERGLKCHRRVHTWLTTQTSPQQRQARHNRRHFPSSAYNSPSLNISAAACRTRCSSPPPDKRLNAAARFTGRVSQRWQSVSARELSSGDDGDTSRLSQHFLWDVWKSAPREQQTWKPQSTDALVWFFKLTTNKLRASVQIYAEINSFTSCQFNILNPAARR